MDESAGRPGRKLDGLFNAPHQLTRILTFRSGQFQQCPSEEEELLCKIMIKQLAALLVRSENRYIWEPTRVASSKS